MARGPKIWNEQTIENFKKEGRGSGYGSDYKPWLTVSTISSKGTSNRYFGLKTGREHHLLSNIERDIFLWAEWATNIIDIREQFPLDRDITLEIAVQNGLRHPYYPGTNTATVMTLDFLLTAIKNGQKHLIAISGKAEGETEDENSINKLEIMRRYCDGAGFPHYIILNSKIPKIPLKNITWIRNAYLKEGESEPFEGYYKELQQYMADDLARGNKDNSLLEYCTTFDIRHAAQAGIGMRVARQLMFDRVIKPDLYNNDLRNAPIASFLISSPLGKLRAIN